MTVDKQTSCILWGAERKPPTLILWNALSLWDERTNTELKTVGDISQQKLAFLFLSITLNGICSFPLGLHQGGMSAFPPEGLFLHNHINPIALASRIQYITSHYHLGFARHQWIQLNCATRQKEKKKIRNCHVNRDWHQRKIHNPPFTRCRLQELTKPLLWPHPKPFKILLHPRLYFLSLADSITP